MLTRDKYVHEVFRIAREMGYPLEHNARNGLLQINFGHKKLHTEHIEKLYPNILEKHADISALIEDVAPGRPCTHKPMREIIEQLSTEKDAD